LAVGFWFLVIYMRLLAVGGWLLAYGYWPMVIGYWLLVDNYKWAGTGKTNN